LLHYFKLLNFSSPLPRGRQSFYAEGSGLRSSRDSDAVAQQWYKNQGTSQQNDWVAQALSKMQTDINRLRRRVMPLIQTFEAFHPFKIYQPNNLAQFVGQMMPMFTTVFGGASTPCTITAANVPTNLAAMPPTVSIADIWRFFAVRSGIVEFRPIYTNEYNGPNSYVPTDPNNWGLKMGAFNSGDSSFPVITGTDGIGVWDTNAGIRNQFDDQTETAGSVCIIGINPNMTQPVNVALWIQITPDTTTAGPTFTINGIASNLGNILGTSGISPGPNSIPIGEVFISADLSTFLVYQEVFDHINNRYPPGTGNFIPGHVQLGEQFYPQSSMLCVRGTWELDTTTPPGTVTANPTDLVSQLFYPGDVVIYLDPIGATQGFHVPWYGFYQFTGSTPAFFSSSLDGPTSDSNWTLLMPAAAPT